MEFTVRERVHGTASGPRTYRTSSCKYKTRGNTQQQWREHKTSGFRAKWEKMEKLYHKQKNERNAQIRKKEPRKIRKTQGAGQARALVK
jgi:hypothetical protein